MCVFLSLVFSFMQLKNNSIAYPLPTMTDDEPHIVEPLKAKEQ